MFTQTANWWHQLVMLTSSRCLLGIIKMLRFCTASFCVRVDHARPKAPRRPGAEWLILAWGALSKSLLHSSARLCLPCLEGGSSMCCWVWSSILPRCSHFAQMPSYFAQMPSYFAHMPSYFQVCPALFIAPTRQWPKVYDLCHTFLHVTLARKNGHARIASKTRAILTLKMRAILDAHVFSGNACNSHMSVCFLVRATYKNL